MPVVYENERNDKMKKKICSVLVAASLLVCAGCTDKTANKNVEKGSGEMPESISIFCEMGGYALKAGATDNNGILGFQEMEKKTGCHIDWVHPTTGAAEEKFNLMIASGKLPDMIVWHWWDVSGGAQSFADDGVIIPLTDMVEEYMPNLTKFLNENPDVKKQIVADDGEIYYVPIIRKDKQLKVFEGPQIRMDWLEKLGLDVPTTPEQLYETLKAFKEKDPNGNGERDEIPMSGVGFNNEAFGIGNLLWGFGTNYDFYIKDGKVTYPLLESEFDEGLAYITKLYKENLIDSDYLLNDRDKMDSKVMSNKTGFVYSMQPGMYYNNINDGTRKVLGIPHPSVKDGIDNVYAPSYIQDTTYASMAVTTANKNPAGCLKWLDNFYGGEGEVIANFGEEGKTYEMVDGKHKLTDYILKNPDGKTPQEMLGASLVSYQATFPCMQTWEYYEQILTPWGRESIETWAGSARTTGILPKLSFNSEENREIANKMTDISTYFNEQVNKIIIGQESIEHLDEVRKKAQKMGLDDIVKIYNDAYKRYMSR